jgi:hypothetical protein
MVKFPIDAAALFFNRAYRTTVFEALPDDNPPIALSDVELFALYRYIPFPAEVEILLPADNSTLVAATEKLGIFLSVVLF